MIPQKAALEAAGESFDFVLLDCPPSLGLLTINGLAVANEVIIPMQPHFLALQGVGKLLETVQLVNKRMNPALRVSGIALTMFDSQAKLSNEVVFDLQRFIDEAKGTTLPWAEAKIFDTKIRRNIKLAESPSFGQTIIAYDPSSNGATTTAASPKRSPRDDRTPDTQAPTGGGLTNVHPLHPRPLADGLHPQHRQTRPKRDNSSATPEISKTLPKPPRICPLEHPITVVILINLYPYTNGHLLIAPRHIADPEDLTPEELLDINTQSVAAIKLLKRAVSPQGFNVGINLARVAGLPGVPGHLHQHVVPRWNGDTNFMTVVGEVRVVPQAMSQLYHELAKVRDELASLKT